LAWEWWWIGNGALALPHSQKEFLTIT
jgi:hypothetical protein